MSFRFIDHTADIAVEVRGNSINELFNSACDAWLESVVEVKNEVKESSKKFIFNSSSLEGLLVDLLNEINFQLLTKKWCFISIKELSIQEVNSMFHLEVEMFGQQFNPFNHFIKTEIKAVTFHQMKIEKKENIFFTLIVFDI